MPLRRAAKVRVGFVKVHPSEFEAQRVRAPCPQCGRIVVSDSNRGSVGSVSEEEGQSPHGVGESGGTTTYVRLNVNINSDAAAAIRDISKKRHISITEVIRRAIAIFQFLEHETATGSKIQLVDKSGHIREIVLI